MRRAKHISKVSIITRFILNLEGIMLRRVNKDIFTNIMAYIDLNAEYDYGCKQALAMLIARMKYTNPIPERLATIIMLAESSPTTKYIAEKLEQWSGRSLCQIKDVPCSSSLEYSKLNIFGKILFDSTEAIIAGNRVKRNKIAKTHGSVDSYFEKYYYGIDIDPQEIELDHIDELLDRACMTRYKRLGYYDILEYREELKREHIREQRAKYNYCEDCESDDCSNDLDNFILIEFD